MKVAGDLGLNARDSQSLVDGLRTVDAVELQIAQTSAMIGVSFCLTCFSVF